jgi:methylamine dehydrogenase accessory protein MauD
MSTLFIGSYIAIWVVLLALSLTVVALARQIALLHSRVLPAGAKINHAGPAIGKIIQSFQGEDIYGNQVLVPGNGSKSTLVLFLSEGCSVCAHLAPGIVALARQEKRHLEVVLASFNGDAASNRLYARKIGLSQFPFVLSTDFAYSLGVLTAPYALLVDDRGTLRAKGLVNSKEHLDSLLNAVDTGFGSREEYIRRRSRQTTDDSDLLEGQAVEIHREASND